jgi:hypothetical protein
MLRKEMKNLKRVSKRKLSDVCDVVKKVSSEEEVME